MRTLLAAVLAASAVSSVAEAQSLHLEGWGRAADVSASELRALPHVQVRVDQHGHAHEFSGVPMAKVLSEIGVDLTRPLSGPHLADVVRVTASDGYQVVLALSEIDPATRKGEVIIADTEGGGPLPEGEGPFRLVVADDLRPARSARQVTRIEVLDLSTSAKAGARRR